MVVTAKKNIKKAKAGRKDLWSETDKALAKKLWGKGFSARQIAGQLEGHHTRNAIISLMHRSGLSDSKPVSPRSNLPRQPRDRVKPVKSSGSLALKGFHYVSAGQGMQLRSAEGGDEATNLPTLNINCEPVQLVDLQDHHCRWPLDDGRFCGRTKKLGEVLQKGRVNLSSYCNEHHGIVHRKHEDARPSPKQGF